MTSSTAVNSKVLGARRLRQDIVSQKELRLQQRIKHNNRLREKQITTLDYLSGQLLKPDNQDQYRNQHKILSGLVEHLAEVFEFNACGLLWVNANCMLELYQVTPSECEDRIQAELDRLRQTGAIVRVLQNNKPALKESSVYGEWLVYHAIRTDDHVLGLLVGVLPEQGMIDGVLLKIFDLILSSAARDLDRFANENRQAADRLYRIEHDDIERYGGRLKFISDRDRLTGLANRENFIHHLGILTGAEEPKPLAVVSFDFDQFSRVNDTFGYMAGDQVLSEATRRLENKLADSEFVDRLGGDRHAILLARIGEDEFGLIAELGEDMDDTPVESVVKELLDELGRHYCLDDGDVVLNCSAGVSRFPQNADDSRELLIQALRARTAARQAGEYKVALYKPSMQDSGAITCLLRERELSHALHDDQIRVWYQPKIDLKTEEIVGAEALVRWHHPENGILLPESFISLAEATGLIQEIGERVLREACKLIGQADDAGYKDFTVSVNLSPSQLQSESLLEQFRAILDTHKVGPERIELEFNELEVEKDHEHILTAIAELAKMGFRISLDNFGRGKTSLATLRSLPLKLLKIDQTFIQGLQDEDEGSNEAIVNALVSIGRNMNVRVLAEGVESAEQLKGAQDLGCDQVQGFYLAKPTAAADFEELLSEWKALSELSDVE